MSSVLLWKEEPASPLSYDEVTLLDTTFYQTTPEDPYDIKFESDLTPCESKAEVASQILENLENLMDLDDLIKEEPFLLDEKMLPILDEVEPPRAIAVPVQIVKSEYNKAPDTQYLLKEFETMYDVVEFTHGTLTPPQSPPSGQPNLTTLEPLLTPTAYSIIPENKLTLFSMPEKQLLPEVPPVPYTHDISYPPADTPQPDIAHELAVVDELVRTRVEDMQWSSSSSNPGSPGSSSTSNFGDCSSDDPEWMPETIQSYTNDETTIKTPRKKSKPYTKGATEDKKVRKKEQNKNAATRYRLKKKAEVEEILTEEKGLLDTNSDLKNNITDLQREIKYLKGLMRDLFKAKGLIN
ncbi:activating transcription factor of chaperone isoform X1 [Anoplophora glabripennis]|uniref:activating transcription factor of chaperone isoform X1 n=1 Tax=Anoplophora glabripennis TaxID=217634 RepID=UPI0008751888|nr:activating transcription factor of chaperone isoform X1 [Anoplophora glabripennis]